MSYQTPNNYDFFLEPQDSRMGLESDKLLEWAQTNLMRPESERRLLELNLSLSAREVVEKESTLYLDRHTRDAELGRQLVEPFRERWENLVKQVREMALREQRQISIARARLETMKRVNAIERNAALRYPRQAIDEAEAEVMRVQAASAARSLLVPALSLDRLLHLSSGAETEAFEYDCEQALRMLSQGVKGYLKVFAFSEKFANRNRLRRDLAIGPNLAQVPVGISFPLTHWPELGRERVEALISQETAAYLHYQLKMAMTLCASAISQWGEMREHYADADLWPTLFCALRAVIDIYHFCAFEIHFGLRDVMIDRSEPSRPLIFNPEANNWRQVDERPWIDKPLKRWIAESIVLMHTSEAVLAESGENGRAKLSAQHPLVFMPGNFQPYFSIGLANLPARGAISADGLASVRELTNALLCEIVRAEPEEFPIAAEDIGSWMAGVMELDTRIFTLSPDQPLIGESERAYLLTLFWRELGHWRSADLISREYAQQIIEFREQWAAPQASEEAEGFDKIELQPIEEEEEEVDHLLGAMAADEKQHLLDALNLSWSIVQPSLQKLTALHTQSTIDEIVKEFVAALAAHSTQLAESFPENWIISADESWSLLRMQSPTACDFLNQFHERTDGVEIFGQMPWSQMLASMLRLAGDLTRLKLLIETCSPTGGFLIEEEAEPSARLLLQAMLSCHRYVHSHGLTEVPPLDEIIFAYFDEDHFQNAWSAFIDRCLSELEQFLVLMNSERSAHSLCQLITTAMIQIQRTRPHRED